MPSAEEAAKGACQQPFVHNPCSALLCSALLRSAPRLGQRACFAPAQADAILPDEQLAPWWRPGQRLAAAFAPQPRTILVAVGNRLLRCREPATGTPPDAPTLMHARPAGEEITGVATLPEVQRPLRRICLDVVCRHRTIPRVQRQRTIAAAPGLPIPGRACCRSGWKRATTWRVPSSQGHGRSH